MNALGDIGLGDAQLPGPHSRVAYKHGCEVLAELAALSDGLARRAQLDASGINEQGDEGRRVSTWLSSDMIGMLEFRCTPITAT